MNTYSKLSDAELFALLQKGEQQVFTEIYERYWSLLLLHAIKMVKDEDEAQDAVQDVFQILLERSSRMDIHTSLSSYLYTSIRYRILKNIRHSKVVEKYLFTLKTEMESGIESTDQGMEEKELARRIEDALNQLPPKMREVFELSRIHEYSYKQISQELGLAENTVKKQISKALKVMRRNLGKGYFFFF